MSISNYMISALSREKEKELKLYLFDPVFLSNIKHACGTSH